MSNHEIEDVLSSIRRLVSEDLRPAARNSAMAETLAEPQTMTAAAQGDKLLLTPAFRVVSPVVDEEIVTSDTSAAQDQTHSDFVEEQVQAADPHQSDATSPAGDDWSMAAVSSDWTEEAPANSENPASVEDVVARLGAAVPSDDAEWESPVGDVDALTENPWPSEPAAQSFAFVHRPRISEAAPAPADSGLEIEQDYMDSPTEAFAPVAEDEPSVWEDPAPQAAQVAPRRIVTPPRGEEERGWADEAEAAVMEDLARDVEQEVGGLFDDGQGGMTFDEEVLRDLVRDIIREELSGTLGERITRNVRKLVRAEIARALAVREFE